MLSGVCWAVSDITRLREATAETSKTNLNRWKHIPQKEDNLEFFHHRKTGSSKWR